MSYAEDATPDDLEWRICMLIARWEALSTITTVDEEMAKTIRAVVMDLRKALNREPET